MALQAIEPAGRPVSVKKPKSLAAGQSGGTAQPTSSKAVPAKAVPAKAAFGAAPAATVSLSAQAQASAIKHGNDPDGLQDGK
jgi:hypothetical protein